MANMDFILADNAKKITRAADLAAVIWKEHYTPIIGGAQVAYMVKKYTSAEAITAQIENHGYTYYLFSDGEEAFGYLAYYIDDGLFLSKLYLLNSHRGKGYARLALDMLKDVCRERGLRRIWLQVNKNNINSINAYRALGFEIFEEKVTDIGEGYVMDDYFMQTTINK